MADSSGGVSRDRWKRYTSELIGTFALVVIGTGAVMVGARTQQIDHQGVALAFGLVVTMIVAATGHLGGSHINPAVTIGFWSVGRFPARDLLPYIVAQCLGAIAGSLLLCLLLGPDGNFGATVPALPLVQSFVVEMGYTGVLGFVVMGVATDRRTPPSVAPFAIGATIYVGALVTGPLTGASFNPARSLGPAVIGGVWTAHWLYWLAPIVGMVIGMKLYDALRSAGAPPTPTAGVTGVEGSV